MQITSNFPGGNIIVDAIQGDTVRLHADLRDTEGDWFYWYFLVKNAESRKIRFDFSGGRALAVRGPAVSTDAGQAWKWLGHESVEVNSFHYTFGLDEKETLFSMTIPYTESHWISFLSNLADRQSLVEIRKIDFSRQGRPVEALAFGCRHQAPDHRVVLTARHHACETMGSYALEGLIAFVLSDAPEAVQLRDRVEFLAVPFVDRDGVEAGDQGKNRRPRDHNRDYDGQGLYPETIALRKLLPSWSQGRLHVALDFHCPWIAGGLNEKLYLVGSAHPQIWEEQLRFAQILERVRTGPLPFRASDSLPYGQDWNTAANYQSGRAFGNWVSDLPGIRLSGSLEVPYANASGAEVTAATARAFGADLGRALATYLKD